MSGVNRYGVISKCHSSLVAVTFVPDAWLSAAACGGMPGVVATSVATTAKPLLARMSGSPTYTYVAVSAAGSRATASRGLLASSATSVTPAADLPSLMTCSGVVVANRCIARAMMPVQPVW